MGHCEALRKNVWNWETLKCFVFVSQVEEEPEEEPEEQVEEEEAEDAEELQAEEEEQEEEEDTVSWERECLKNEGL